MNRVSSSFGIDINIVNIKDRQRVVTTVELLNPTNKAQNTEGWRLYKQKQEEVLASRTHLIEIDLLRQGEHTVAVPREPLLREGHWDYIICLHRGGQSVTFQVWLNTVREQLPRIAVPLDAPDPDAILDLQMVLDRYYDAGGYAREIDYSREPIPPFRGEDAEWADELLRQHGLRS